MVSTSKTRIRSYCELSVTLDQLSGRSVGHAFRACLLGFPLGRELGFSTAQLGDLLATILIKDLVTSHGTEPTGHGAILRLFERLQKAFGRMTDAPLSAAERHTARIDDVAGRLALSPCVRMSLTALREHWDGSGPLELEANTVPLIAATALAAEAAEIAWSTGGTKAAKSAIRRGSGKVFSPDVASAFDRASRHPLYWSALEATDLAAAVIALEPAHTARQLDDAAQAAITGLASELSIRLLALRTDAPRQRSRNRKAA
jgi:hypothetical protein